MMLAVMLSRDCAYTGRSIGDLTTRLLVQFYLLLDRSSREGGRTIACFLGRMLII